MLVAHILSSESLWWHRLSCSSSCSRSCSYNGLFGLFRRTDQTLRFHTNVPLDRVDLFCILTMDLKTTTTIAVLGSIRA